MNKSTHHYRVVLIGGLVLFIIATSAIAKGGNGNGRGNWKADGDLIGSGAGQWGKPTVEDDGAVPNGWSQGEKTGWNGADTPPGLSGDENGEGQPVVEPVIPVEPVIDPTVLTPNPPREMLDDPFVSEIPVPEENEVDLEEEDIVEKTEDNSDENVKNEVITIAPKVVFENAVINNSEEEKEEEHNDENIENETNNKETQKEIVERTEPNNSNNEENIDNETPVGGETDEDEEEDEDEDEDENVRNEKEDEVEISVENSNFGSDGDSGDGSGQPGQAGSGSSSGSSGGTGGGE